MLQLQRNSAKAEIYLQNRFERDMIFALANHFKGKEQKQIQKEMSTTL